MKSKKWKVYALFVAVSEAVGILSACLSRQGMAQYEISVQKPPLSPPGWLFAVVWTILYALMGISAARIWLSEQSAVRKIGLNLFVAQLIVNFFWSPIFFILQAFGLAFVWLLVLLGLVIWMAYNFYRLDALAGSLQIPYTVWLLFAAYLSAGVWLFNR